MKTMGRDKRPARLPRQMDKPFGDRSAETDHTNGQTSCGRPETSDKND
jgi:hypothetical protein